VYTLLIYTELLPYLIASVVGYTAGLLNSYFLNKIWTFQDPRPHDVKRGFVFILVNLVTAGTNLIILSTLVEQFGLDRYLAQVFATCFSFPIKFIGIKLLVFKSK
jgi:putative flippase GtrA